MLRDGLTFWPRVVRPQASGGSIAVAAGALAGGDAGAAEVRPSCRVNDHFRTHPFGIYTEYFLKFYFGAKVSA
jgi:hypothetical protein